MLAELPTRRPEAELQRMAMLLAIGWLITNIALSIADLPLKYLLKDTVHLGPVALASFFAIGNFSNYLKPVAGVLTDSVPLFGTRRRWYLLLSTGIGGLFWILLALVPRTYYTLLLIYSVFYITVVFFSTTLGGKMVEVAQEHSAAGRLTAQRIGTFRAATIVGGLAGGYLATRPFGLTAAISASLHFGLLGLYWSTMREPRTDVVRRSVWKEALGQLRILIRSRTLLIAAGLVFLLAIAPGFGTPLFFYQTNTLKFSSIFIGQLTVISSVTGLFGAWLYYHFCRRYSLRLLLGSSIIVHALGTITYLSYHTHLAAIVITAINGITVTMATLPIYDLAVRATPRGSEAIGYSVMMSAWNLTNALSDVIGSRLYERHHIGFFSLVWLNAGTTAIILLAIPILPAALLAARDTIAAPAPAGA